MARRPSPCKKKLGRLTIKTVPSRKKAGKKGKFGEGVRRTGKRSADNGWVGKARNW